MNLRRALAGTAVLLGLAVVGVGTAFVVGPWLVDIVAATVTAAQDLFGIGAP